MARATGSRLALAAWLAASACGGKDGVPANAPTLPEPQLATLAELQAAVKRNLERGALVSFWATW
jgi:hypothetical protein